MSEVSANPPRMTDGKVSSPLPNSIVTDYGNQLMMITVPGEWSGSMDAPTPITLTVSYDSSMDESTISFCFKLALPGETATAELTCDGASFPITLGVPV